MAHANYRFVLAKSSNLENIENLKLASDRSFTLSLNRAGSCTFRFPMNVPIAAEFKTYSRAIKIYRNNVVIWSGYILQIDEDVSNGMMTVSAVGWLQRLEKRVLRQQKIYTAQDDAAIIQSLLAEANLTTAPDGYVVPVVTGSTPLTPTWLQWGGTSPNEGPGGPTPYIPLTDSSMGGTGPNYAARTKTWEQYQSILNAMQEMTEIENGCDIWVHPETRALYVFRKQQRILDTVHFGYRWGPNNIQQFGRQLDGSTQINYHVSTGRPGVTAGFDHEPGYQSEDGLLEEHMALSDVGQTNILTAFSAAEVILRRTPRVLYSITPSPFVPGSQRVPEPLVSYRVGDLIYFTALYPPRIDIRKQGVRVFGMTISITSEGNEVLGSLVLSPS